MTQRDTTFLFEYDLKYVGSSYRFEANDLYKVDYLADLLLENPKMTVHIRGHVCCGPSKRVSTKRAEHIYNYLIYRGVPENQLSFKGYSDTMPIVTPEKSDEDKALNRRVDFMITLKV